MLDVAHLFRWSVAIQHNSQKHWNIFPILVWIFKNSVAPEIGLFLCNHSLTTISTSLLLWNQLPKCYFIGSDKNMLPVIPTTSAAAYQQIRSW